MTTLTRDLRIKVTPLQLEIIRNKAQVSGFKSVSSYVRDVLLKTDYSMENLIREIHEKIVKGEK